MQRLSSTSLASSPAGIAVPTYDRAALRSGIVHLGLGAFHRAHQAVYTEQVLADGDLRWGITAASLRSPDTRDALQPQDGLYTVEQRGEEDRLSVIGALHRILVAPEQPQALIEAMAGPETAIVSLTVTEKAYLRDPASGALAEDDPLIRHDLANPHAPRSVFGFLAAAIDVRRKAGLTPFTILSCDNLPQNGRTLHGLLVRFAQLRDPDLAAYIAGEIACPDTMVDRIVPATTDADRARISARLGLEDAWPVVAEPFTQWVIQNRFTGPRPAWESAGATLVDDVAPFEMMKLRLLNGSHSALAYLGYLGGYETVAEAMAASGLADFIAHLMDDAAVTLDMPSGVDVDAYKDSLLTRFRNPALRHRTWQIAMDGSQKLPQRLLAPVRDRLVKGLPIDSHALAIAAWMHYVAGRDERGQPIDVRDPMATHLAAVSASAGSAPAQQVEALINQTAIFGDLSSHPVLREAVSAALARLVSVGAIRAAQECTAAARQTTTTKTGKNLP